MNSEKVELLTSDTEPNLEEMELLRLETEKQLNVFLTNLTEASKKHNLPKPDSLSVKIELNKSHSLSCGYNVNTRTIICTW